jgi:hypothetical protein
MLTFHIFEAITFKSVNFWKSFMRKMYFPFPEMQQLKANTKFNWFI